MQIHGNETKNSVIGEPVSSADCAVHFNSEGCTLEIGKECKLDGLSLNFNRPNQLVRFSGHNVVRGQIYLTAARTRVIFGDGSRTNSFVWMNLAEADTAVLVGEHCLLASVRFRTSDSHKIIDMASNERINPPGDILVGDRVWIAEDVLLLKGTNIWAGSIIGARSMVTGAIPSNCLAVGTPARVLRTGVRWEE